MSKQKEGNSNRKGEKLVLAVCIAVIIVLLAIVVFLLINRKVRTSQEPEKRNVVVSQDNVEEIASEMISQEYVAPGYYSASMSTTWHFATGDAVSEDAYVANVEENTNDIYFDIFLEGQEDEAIFQSPVIPRGSELNQISLGKTLDAGIYSCIMIYHLIDDEQNTVSTLRVGFTIIIEN